MASAEMKPPHSVTARGVEGDHLIKPRVGRDLRPPQGLPSSLEDFVLTVQGLSEFLCSRS
jgi:hypothetical protein